MDSWVILQKLIILLYCTAKYISYGMHNITAAVLAILFYICMNMIFYIYRRRTVKFISSLLSAVILISMYFISPVFLLLLPLSIADMILSQSGKIYILFIISLIPLLFAGRGLILEYAVVAVLSLLIYMLVYMAHKKIEMQAKNIDELRLKNQNLMSKLDRSDEYVSQLRHITQIEERNRIAQEIHDKIGHSIAGSIIQLEAARALLSKDGVKADRMIERVTDVLREGMEQIRSSLRNLKPPSEELGINRIKFILDRFSSENSKKTILLHSGDLNRITYAQWKVVMENTEEALTNVLKYSFAQSVTVEIEVLNKFVKVEIRDNGVGARVIKKGLGITGMEERCQGLGGKLITDGSKGFSVITLLPIEEGINADKGIDSGR